MKIYKKNRFKSGFFLDKNENLMIRYFVFKNTKYLYKN